MRDRYENSAAARRVKGYADLRAKRDSAPPPITKKEMKADLRQRDLEDAQDKKAEKRWQKALKKDPWLHDVSLEMYNGMQEAYRKYRIWRKEQKVKNETIDVIHHFDATIMAGVAIPVTCQVPLSGQEICNERFNTTKELRRHQKDKHHEKNQLRFLQNKY